MNLILQWQCAEYEFSDIELQTLDIRSEVILLILHVSIKEHHQ